MKDVNSISPIDRRPLYIKAINVITEMVESGEMPVGSQLPPEGDLADMLGISRSTLREALGHLESFGVVTRQQGRGTFVTASQGPDLLGGIERLETFRELVNRAKKDHKVVHRCVEMVQAPERVQADLDIDPNTNIFRVEIVESVDDIPCQYLEDYVIASEDKEEELLNYGDSMLTYLTEEQDPPLAYARSKIFSIGASPEIADRLNIEVGQPVLHLVEKLYDSVGKLIGITYLYQVTDLFYFSVTRRIPPR
jgi:DNA-binding GntR family transcriptional regulator